MKTAFPLSEIMAHRGCYSREMIIDAARGNHIISLAFIVNHPDMQLVHKSWFFANHIELTPQQLHDFAKELSRLALNEYEKRPKASAIPRLALLDDRYTAQAQTIASFQPKTYAYAIFSAITRDPYDRIFSATSALQTLNPLATIEFFRKFLLEKQ